MTKIYKNGHCHCDKRVEFFPKEVFREDIDGEKTFFIPTIPLKTKDKRKNQTPIWECNFTTRQQTKIIKYAAKKGLEINYRDFFKLSVSKTYREREEYILEDVCQN